MKCYDHGLKSPSESALTSSDSEKFQSCFRAVQYLKFSKHPWLTCVQCWKPQVSQLEISSKSALIFSQASLKHQIFKAKIQPPNKAEQRWNIKFSEEKNQRRIRAVSALIFSTIALKHQVFRANKSALNQSCFAPLFSEKELITAEDFWNNCNQFWFSPWQRWTSLNSVSSNCLPHRFLFVFFSRET